MISARPKCIFTGMTDAKPIRQDQLNTIQSRQYTPGKAPQPAHEHAYVVQSFFIGLRQPFVMRSTDFYNIWLPKRANANADTQPML